MKKILAALRALALILSAGTVSTFAAGPARTASQPGRGAASAFADTDGDGVCDNLGTGCGQGFADADGDGVCDNLSTGCGRGFADADGDGVCDNLGTGCGRGLADADGDGVCDNAGGGRSARRSGRRNS